MTQATFGPAVTLDGPLPKKPRYTLLDSAEIVVDNAGDGTPDGERWANGAQIWGYEAENANGFDPCSTGSDRIKADASYIPLPVFGAFTAFKQITCSSRTFVDWETFERRGMAVFNAVESFPVERQLWLSSYVSNPHLNDFNCSPVSAGALSAREGLARLEYTAARVTGRDFVVHASYRMVETWAAMHLIEREGNHLVTGGLGTRIMTGPGYTGDGPNGVPPFIDDVTEWVYATGPVHIHRGPALFVPGEVSQALDQSDNEVMGLFERDYLVTWDTAQQSACAIDRSIAW